MLLGNIDKEQVTTIVLIVAGVIEGILLIALLLNIAKRSKTKKNNMQAMNMFDNSPTGYDYSVQTQPAAYNYDTSQTQTYADPNINTYDATSDNSMNYDANASISPDQSNMVYDNNLVNSSTDTLEAPANPEVMDSGIPSMDYNQETSFDSDNLMEMQKNDTLNVPNSTDYY
jgi:hypothetical protein